MQNVLFQFYLTRASCLSFQRVKNLETTQTLKQFVSGLYFSFISILFHVVRAAVHSFIYCFSFWLFCLTL